MPRPFPDSGNKFPSARVPALDRAIFVFLSLFAIALPFSIKGAERSWKIAFVLWLVKLAIEHVRPHRQPLAAPLLAFVTLSAISTMLSPDPYLSWDRMKFVCLFLVGIVFAQNLKRLSQVRWLVILLILSGFGAAVYTGWQYSIRCWSAPGGVSGGIASDCGGFPTGRHRDLVQRTTRCTRPEQLMRDGRTDTVTARVTVRYLRGLGLDAGATDCDSQQILCNRVSAPSR